MHTEHTYSCMSTRHAYPLPFILPLCLSPFLLFFFLFSHCRVQASLEFRIFFLEVPSVGVTSQCYRAPTHRDLCTHKLTYTHVLPGHTLQNQNFDIPNDLKAFWFIFLSFSTGSLYKFGHSCPLWKGLSCSSCRCV